jgi:NADP-dependent 3-hydroxy acid dehydrogenase YdfG
LLTGRAALRTVDRVTDTDRFSGRTAAVTGGARGIGRAIAAALAGRGMRVAIADVDAEAANATAQQIGGLAHAYGLDVTDESAFAGFIDAVERDLGRLDVLINNAGIMPAGGFLDETHDSTRRQWDINVSGVVNGCRVFLPRCVARGHGHVINVSSVAGKTGYPGIATYSGTKFYVYGFSEALRGELLGTGVDLSVVMPGFVQTDLTAGIGDTRFFKRISPETVAEAVAGAVGRPRFDVHVPKILGPMAVLNSMLPRRARDAFLRFARADRVTLEYDRAARAAYEARAAASIRTAPPVDETDKVAQV